MNAKSILVIEDEKSLLKTLTRKFESEGFFVRGAVNGKEGLSMALEFHPDLILLDIIMPEMDGITMLKKLREDEWGKDVSVMILSNLSDDSKIMTALENNTFDYLIKVNWSLDDLVKKVKEKLA